MQPSVAHPTTAQQSPAVDPHRLRQWRDALHSLLEQSSVRVDTMLEVLDQQQQQPHTSTGTTEEGQLLPLPSSAPTIAVSPLYNDGDSPFGVDGLRQCVVQLQHNTNNNNNNNNHSVLPDTASRAAHETITTTTTVGASATSGHSSSSPILSNDHREGESEFEQLRASDLQLVQYHHHHPATASSTSSSLPNAGSYFTQSPPRRPLLVRRDASDVFFAEEEEQEGLPLQQPCQQQQPSHAPIVLTPTPSSTTIVGVVVPRLQLERPDREGLPYVHSGLSASGSSAWTLLPTPRSPHVPHNRANGGGGGALSLPATPSWRTASPAAEVLSPQRPMSSRSVMDAATQGGTTVALPHGHASRAGGPPPPFVPPQRSSSSSSHSWRTVRPFLSDDNLLPAFLFPGGGVGLHRPLSCGGGGGVGSCCDADAPSPSRSDSTLSTASRHMQHSGSLSSRPLTATSQHPDGGEKATDATVRCDPSSSTTTTVATPSSSSFSRSWRWLHRLPLRVFTGAVHELRMVWSTCRGNAKRVAARCRGLWAHWKHRLLLLGCIRK